MIATRWFWPNETKRCQHQRHEIGANHWHLQERERESKNKCRRSLTIHQTTMRVFLFNSLTSSTMIRITVECNACNVAAFLGLVAPKLAWIVKPHGTHVAAAPLCVTINWMQNKTKYVKLSKKKNIQHNELDSKLTSASLRLHTANNAKIQWMTRWKHKTFTMHIFDVQLKDHIHTQTKDKELHTRLAYKNKQQKQNKKNKKQKYINFCNAQ